MSFQPGELTTTDLSPNANILGTQIADNTIQLRNLTDDTFRVVKTGTYTSTNSYNTTNPGAGKFANDEFTLTTIPHGLGFTPAYLAYARISTTGYIQMPTTSFATASAGANAWWSTFQIEVDNTNIVIILDTMSYGASTTFAAGFSFKYYLLQEKASIT